MRSSVIGSGSFGTALCNSLAVNCEEVRLWGRDAALVEAINTRHENPTYLPGIPLSPRVHATLSLEEALEGSELVVLATPSHATRDIVSRALPALPRHAPLIDETRILLPDPGVLQLSRRGGRARDVAAEQERQSKQPISEPG